MRLRGIRARRWNARVGDALGAAWCATPWGVKRSRASRKYQINLLYVEGVRMLQGLGEIGDTDTCMLR